MKRVIGIIVAIAVIAGVAFGLTYRNSASDGRSSDGRLNVVSSFSIINEISQEFVVSTLMTTRLQRSALTNTITIQRLLTLSVRKTQPLSLQTV